MSGLLPLLKLIFDSGAVSPKAPTFFDKFRDKPKERTGTLDKPGTAFGELGFKKFF
tara:strand:+ start:355 stop:522 length:168 start_codon:yes stop_codon:yes gene_type:complete